MHANEFALFSLSLGNGTYLSQPINALKPCKRSRIPHDPMYEVFSEAFLGFSSPEPKAQGELL